jgi:hypothetical protein
LEIHITNHISSTYFTIHMDTYVYIAIEHIYMVIKSNYASSNSMGFDIFIECRALLCAFAY